ncbi:helix-hairpin-helix domain-containing protein [Mucilaginibacter ginkgonis]|uniref:Helix-hairpin-helix domain-containing protein n=1 Tax=Mucilaginibacter ginkgonis TaxID=2682091 RepID=A0A6I4HZS5_9SPHI|nr:helix-hairpin-helix domain-containing protein [Mucilaginibacter ginkgonis]QQL50036.1 helix-hairpin-helix domain-containing protein [Mucilaginibacter ginkgonis]
MKSDLKNYLSITKKEWNGVIVLVVLIVLVVSAPYVYKAFRKDKTINFAQIDSLVKLMPKVKTTDSTKLNLPSKLTFFNPNQLSDSGWMKLGLNAHQAKMIKHYEEKGGTFKTKQDVKKIYAISAEDYKRLEPYINLPGGETVPAIIDINHADSATVTTLKGVGPAFAMRIIRYRDKLGGFHAKTQLKEVFGIDEEHYLLIKDAVKINANAIKKTNINKATFEDLRRYPYLSYKQINAIIQYRSEHGDYDNFDDLKDVAILDEATLKKIKPYLVFK